MCRFFASLGMDIAQKDEQVFICRKMPNLLRGGDGKPRVLMVDGQPGCLVCEVIRLFYCPSNVQKRERGAVGLKCEVM